jgi:hypothetical protein
MVTSVELWVLMTWLRYRIACDVWPFGCWSKAGIRRLGDNDDCRIHESTVSLGECRIKTDAKR